MEWKLKEIIVHCQEKPLLSSLDVLDSDIELSLLAKALSHEIRVQIIRYLFDKNQCVCGDFVKVLPVAQSTVSQHLKILKDSGLISSSQDGKQSYYCVNKTVLRRFRVLVASL